MRKGCYPGREVVARMHFKGGNKLWLHLFEFTADRLPEPATPLQVGSGSPPGELLNAAWQSRPSGIALAVLPNLASGTVLEAPELPGATFRVVSAVARAND